ncbi:MAG: hypothetical protein JXQ76_08905 [Campylobacterales bacterium]|nr:hypothetical protein [Campylobacterales bacterium]
MFETLKDRYISILPANESFFYTTAVEEKKRFDRDILHLNFAHISPYKDFEILPYYEQKRLLLWFYPKSIEQKNVIIPQSYLLYLYAKEQDNHAIFIVEDTIDTLIVIKNGALEATYCGQGLKEQQEALLDEYGLEKLYTLNAAKARTIEYEQLQSYPIWQYYHWYQNDQSPKEMLVAYLERAVVPIAIIIAVFISSEYAKDQYIASYYENLQEEYKVIKKQNDPYRKNLKAFREEAAFSTSFYNDVLIYPSSIDVMEKLFGIVAQDGNNTIKNFKLSGSKITLNIETFNPITILNAVLKSGYFETFKVQSTRKIPKSEKEYVIYEGNLKQLKDRDE